MTRLDCAGFSAALAEALAERGGAEPDTAAALRDHAAECSACRGSADLVALALAPPGSRDPFPEPPPAYWDGFSDRLAARIERERTRARSSRLLGAAAALLLVGVVVTGFLRESDSRSGTPREVPPLDDAAADPDDRWDPFPSAGALGGFSEDDDGSLFPVGEDLTPEEEERLLDWLRRERERAEGGDA